MNKNFDEVYAPVSYDILLDRTSWFIRRNPSVVAGGFPTKEQAGEWLEGYKKWLAEASQRSETRCNRCAADLCEHDNCTDWTCARACSKCAKGGETGKWCCQREDALRNEVMALEIGQAGSDTPAPREPQGEEQ